ncbi:transporter substrate-binding domain-containing protein [Colwellia sp. 1_MG-2023]|uniref:transporter substrate-binding domain-containing protein n=1 Tax=Colwellia sp. 1_MG-2023 TaxID=3062649 RepID=UPI0026E46CA5|nr:transporter substrate-binding domain-containing protein [Colwellia sp. 1_MG-2023]MDO6445419.1 transporter substrate-binding domain-containing protein [Colwellia sp. 1_MG-2023]
MSLMNCFNLLVYCYLIFSPNVFAAKEVSNAISVIDLYPWGHSPANPQGIVPEFLQLLSEETDTMYQAIIKPYARVESDLRHGKTEFSVLAGGANNREDYVVPGPVIYELNFGIIVRNDSDINSLHDLVGAHIAIMNGLKLSDCFNFTEFKPSFVTNCHSQITEFYRVPVLNYHRGLMMLDAGRVKGVIVSNSTIKRHLRNLKPEEKLSNIDEYSDILELEKVPVQVIYSKTSYNEKRVKKTNAAIDAMLNNGLRKKIRSVLNL